MANPADTSKTPRQQGHWAGWCAGNSLRFEGHAANPYTPVGYLPFIAQWDAGYWEGFTSGQQDHRDHMIDCGRA